MTEIRVARFLDDDGLMHWVTITVELTPLQLKPLDDDPANIMTAARIKASADGMELFLDVCAPNSIGCTDKRWAEGWAALELPAVTEGFAAFAALRAMHQWLGKRARRVRGPTKTGAGRRRDAITEVLCRVAVSPNPDRALCAAVRAVVRDHSPHLGDEARSRAENTLRAAVKRWLTAT